MINEIKIAYKIEVIPVIFFWIFMGRILSDYYSSNNDSKSKILLVGSILFLATFLISYINPYSVDLANNEFKEVFYAFIGGILGISMVFWYSFFIEKSNCHWINNILSYIGKNTIVILSLHQIIITVLNHKIIPIVGNTVIIKIVKYAMMFGILYIMIILHNRIFKKYKCS